MSLPMKALRALTDDDLVEKYDATAVNTGVGLDYYREELQRREQAAANQASDRLARASLRLACATLVLSVVAVAIALLSLLLR